MGVVRLAKAQMVLPWTPTDVTALLSHLLSRLRAGDCFRVGQNLCRRNGVIVCRHWQFGQLADGELVAAVPDDPSALPPDGEC